MATFTDDFVGTNGAALNGRTTTTGGKTWSLLDGIGIVQSNRATFEDDAGHTSVLVADIGTGEQEVSSFLPVPNFANTLGGSNTTTSYGACVIGRCSDASNYWRLTPVAKLVTGSFAYTTMIVLEKVMGGIAQAVAEYAVRRNTAIELRLVMQGVTIIGYTGTVEILRVTDSFNQTATKCGVGRRRTFYGASGSEWQYATLHDVTATALIQPPANAVPVRPVNGAYIDADLENVLTHLYSDPQGSPQVAKRVRLSVDGGANQWVKEDGTLSATEVDIENVGGDFDGGLQFTPLTAGLLDNGHDVQWSVQVKNAVGEWSASYSSLALFQTALTPVLDITEPDAGDVVESSTMTVAYAQAGTGYIVTTHQAKVFTAAQVADDDFDPETTVPEVADTGWLAANGVQEIDVTGIPLEGELVLYVRARFSDGPDADWVTREFSALVPPAPVPIITAVYDPSEARTAIQVIGTGNLLSEDGATFATEVGEEWQPDGNTELTQDGGVTGAHGEGVGVLTAVADGTMSISTTIPVGAAGQFHTFSAEARAVAGTPRELQVTVEYLDDDGNVLVALSSDPVLEGDPGEQPGVTYFLRASPNPDRSSATDLDDATLAGEWAVFVTPATQVEFVSFSLDGGAIVSDSTAPFDLVGGTTAAAIMLDTADLDNGAHDLEAVVHTTGGDTVTLTAEFTVDNEAPPADHKPISRLMPSQEFDADIPLTLVFASSNDPGDDGVAGTPDDGTIVGAVLEIISKPAGHPATITGAYPGVRTLDAGGVNGIIEVGLTTECSHGKFSNRQVRVFTAVDADPEEPENPNNNVRGDGNSPLVETFTDPRVQWTFTGSQQGPTFQRAVPNIKDNDGVPIVYTWDRAFITLPISASLGGISETKGVGESGGVRPVARRIVGGARTRPVIIGRNPGDVDKGHQWMVGFPELGVPAAGGTSSSRVQVLRYSLEMPTQMQILGVGKLPSLAAVQGGNDRDAVRSWANDYSQARQSITGHVGMGMMWTRRGTRTATSQGSESAQFGLTHYLGPYRMYGKSYFGVSPFSHSIPNRPIARGANPTLNDQDPWVGNKGQLYEIVHEITWNDVGVNNGMYRAFVTPAGGTRTVRSQIWDIEWRDRASVLINILNFRLFSGGVVGAQARQSGVDNQAPLTATNDNSYPRVGEFVLATHVDAIPMLRPA